MESFYYLFTSFFANTTTTGSLPCPDVNGGTCDTGLPAVDTTAAIHVITQVAFGIIGAVAVIIIILAGIRLVTSGGDPDAVSNARNTIIYASLGLVVALAAEFLVTYVLTKI